MFEPSYAADLATAAQATTSSADIALQRDALVSIASGFQNATAVIDKDADSMLKQADSNEKVAAALDALTSQQNSNITERILSNSGIVTSDEMRSYLADVNSVNTQLLTQNNSIKISVADFSKTLGDRTKSTDNSVAINAITTLSEVATNIDNRERSETTVLARAIKTLQEGNSLSTQSAESVASIVSDMQKSDTVIEGRVVDTAKQVPSAAVDGAANSSRLTDEAQKQFSNMAESITSNIRTATTSLVDESGSAALQALGLDAGTASSLFNSMKSVSSSIFTGISAVAASTKTAEVVREKHTEFLAKRKEAKDIKADKKERQRADTRATKQERTRKRAAATLAANTLQQETKQSKRDKVTNNVLAKILKETKLGNNILLITSALGAAVSVVGRVVGGIASAVGGIASFFGLKKLGSKLFGGSKQGSLNKTSTATNASKTSTATNASKTSTATNAKTSTATNAKTSTATNANTSTATNAKTSTATNASKTSTSIDQRKTPSKAKPSLVSKVVPKAASKMAKIAARHVAASALTAAFPPALLAVNAALIAYDIFDIVTTASSSSDATKEAGSTAGDIQSKVSQLKTASASHTSSEISTVNKASNDIAIKKAIGSTKQPIVVNPTPITVNPPAVNVQQSSSQPQRSISIDDPALSLLNKSEVG